MESERHNNVDDNFVGGGTPVSSGSPVGGENFVDSGSPVGGENFVSSGSPVVGGTPVGGENIVSEENRVKETTAKGGRLTELLPYIFAPVACLIFFVAYVAYMRVFPFGDRIMSSYDLLAQIGPLGEHFFDVIEGRSSLFYSFSVAGGADMFGSLAYCFISPFTFIFLLGGKGMVNSMVPFVLAAKIACISVAAVYFMKKLFSLPPVAVTFLAVLYTFGGYFHVANTYIIWLDFLIWLPLAAVAFKRLVNSGKFLPFSIFTALFIYTCFSIACFSLLVIFLIIIAYIYTVVPKTERREKVTKVCLGLVLAVAFALPVLIPALAAYMRSGRNTGLFSNLFNRVTPDHLYGKLTYIICDGVFFSMSAVYLALCKKREGINKFLFITIALVLAPVLVDEVCLLLNAGSYMSYSLRFGFLNTLLSLYLSCRCAELILSVEDVKEKKVLKGTLTAVLSAVLFLIVAGVTYCMQNIIENGKDTFLFTKGIIKEGGLLYKMYEESDFTASFSSKFAHSIGGLEVFAFIFGATFIATVTVLLLTRYRIMPKKIAAVAVAAIGLLQAGYTVYHTVAGNTNTVNTSTYAKVNAVLDKIDELEDGDRESYRIKDYSNVLTADAPLTLHYRGYTVFSSVIDSANFVPSDLFRYTGNGVNTIKSQGGDVFSDSLFGYKYAFTQSSYVSGNRTYYSKIGEYDGYFLYRNDLAFPTAFVIPGGECDFDGLRRDEAYDKLYNYLGGEGELAVETHPKVTLDEEGGFYKVSFESEALRGCAFVAADFPEGINPRYTDAFIYNEENSRAIGDMWLDYGVLNGSRARKTIAIRADEGLTAEMIEESMVVVVISQEKVKSLHDIAWKKAAEVKFGPHGMEIKATAEAGEKIFVNYVAIDGYAAEVNGKKAELESNGIGFIAAPLEQGENTVVFTYRSPYVKLIIVGLIVGALLAAAVILIFIYYEKVKKWLEKVVDFSADALAFFILGFGFLYPIGVFLWKCFKAVFKL